MLQTDGTCTIFFFKCYFLSLYNLLFIINIVYTFTAWGCYRPPDSFTRGRPQLGGTAHFEKHWFRGMGLLVQEYFYFFAPNTHWALNCSCTIGKRQVPFSMAIGSKETRAWVFSRTLLHGNSKNEIRQINRRR